MKRFLTLCLLLLLAAGCAVGRPSGKLERIGRALDMDLSGGTVARFEDSHGGFLGDGLTAAEVEIGGLAAPAPVGEHRPGPPAVRAGGAAGGGLLLPL